MKQGRVLSAGTRQNIEDAIAAMGDATAALRAAGRKLRGLLDSADKPPEPEGDEKNIGDDKKITLLLEDESVNKENKENEILDLQGLVKNESTKTVLPVIKLADLKALIKSEAEKIEPALVLKDLLDAQKGKII